MDEIDPKQLLHRGDYREVLARYETTPKNRVSRDWLIASIGSLSFLGRTQEAQLLFESSSSKFSKNEKVESLFFLTINFARTQDHKTARTHLRAMKNLERGLRGVSKFYILQAQAFLRHYRSQFRSSEILARSAFKESVQAGFSYGRILSADLLGHSLVQLDQIREGIKSLKDAAASAKTINLESIHQAIQVSILLYESQFGLRPGPDAIIRLRALIRRLQISDSYTRINLYFELIRSLTLTGLYREAETELQNVFELIYLFNNPRQETTFKLRYAELCLLRGRPHEALEKVLDAKRWSGLVANRQLRAQLLGLEFKIVGELGFSETRLKLAEELRQMARSFPTPLNLRITERLLNEESKVPVPSSDRIGTLLANLQASESVARIVESGCLSLLSRRIKLHPGQEALVWDLERGSLTIFSSGEILHLPALRSPQSRRILSQLSKGPVTKEALVRNVWRYAYHPLKHDSLLYAAIAQCRKLLGSASHWIENRENTYGLKSDVTTISLDSEGATPLENSVPSILQIDNQPDLNHRQIHCLSRWGSSPFRSIKQHQQELRVSRNTATRDLRQLEDLGFLRSLGRGPSRRYTRVALGDKSPS
jgi:DNA-binding transcriptional ArsR family regulator